MAGSESPAAPETAPAAQGLRARTQGEAQRVDPAARGTAQPVFVFDAYGTLFDVHSAVSRHAARIGPDAAGLSALWRTKQLEYSWTRSLMGRYRPFWSLTCDALAFALDSFPEVDRTLEADLLDAYETLSAYPEVEGVLGALKARGARTAILSNGSAQMLQSAVASAGIGAHLDAVLSVDALERYKTDPATYTLVLDQFGAAPQEVRFYSSNRWDIAGAKAFGFGCVWVNRLGAPDEYADLAPDETVSDLGSAAAQ